MDNWTYGCELEISDSERDTPLPGKSTWDKKDYTIVNSNGVANDPKGRLWKFGGEINTEPTSTIDDQINVIQSIYHACTPTPTTNYRSNLHIHIRVPGLADNVPLVKSMLEYTYAHDKKVFDWVDPLPPEPEWGTLAHKRWKRRKASHHTSLTEVHMARIRVATTPAELRAAHVPWSEHAGPQFHLAQRAGINFRALWEGYETIEFRHFCLEFDFKKLRDAFVWCQLYTQSAMSNIPLETLRQYTATRIQLWQPLINEWQEERYIQSSRRYNTEGAVRAVIEKWRKEGTL